MQLRREHRSPFHEFIIVHTQAGHSYGVERGTDGGVVGAMSAEGAPAHDTISLLSSTEYDQTSSCVINLRWGDH